MPSALPSPLSRTLWLLLLACACDADGSGLAADAGSREDAGVAADGDGDAADEGDGVAGAGDGTDDGDGDGDGDGDADVARRVVGYLPVWRGVADWAGRVDGAGLTHLLLAFANPEEGVTPTLAASDEELAQLVEAAHAAGTRVLISIGGGSGSGAVTPLLAPDQAAAFVAELVAYVLAHELDGVDVDVEGSVPGSADYAPFVTSLAAALHAEHKLVTAALATWTANDIEQRALDSFDFINVMSYDHCGSWTGACEQSTYDAAVTDLATFAGRGVPAQKLVLGVPFYAWCWGQGCSAEAYTYAELVQAYPDAPQEDWIERGDVQLSYNGEATMARKVALARSHGGVMIWELGQDAAGERSLLSAIVKQLSAP